MTTLADLTARTPGLPCRNEPDAFFSTRTADCMRYALDTQQQHGVWGGVDFEARAMGCGTERGYQIHIRRKEPACPACQGAHDEAVEANRRRILVEAHKAGGTTRGYWMHRRLGEEACVPCKRACARQSQERRDRERADAERARAAWGTSGATEPLPGAPAAVQPLALAG